MQELQSKHHHCGNVKAVFPCKKRVQHRLTSHYLDCWILRLSWLCPLDNCFTAFLFLADRCFNVLFTDFIFHRNSSNSAAAGLLDLKAAILESLTAIKRAGADILITYFAKEAAELIK